MGLSRAISLVPIASDQDPPALPYLGKIPVIFGSAFSVLSVDAKSNSGPVQDIGDFGTIEILIQPEAVSMRLL